ncbi:MAG: hypothetical protein PHX13_02655 [Thiovulaceae bacterium]|nr:hypothetical protein [Sulfurimonadaceae bacterium]
MREMTLEGLKNKKILLFGKPRAFNHEEFLYQIQECKIELVGQYNENVAFIVEGKLITPYEQNDFDALYEAGLKEKFITINELENLLIKNIDEDALLMSLKLSHDKERLFAYIKNSQINDTLFLKLIKLYDWQNEGFFDNDENRDVTAALISRFYENIERNHNVQYATLGLMHLVEQSNNSDLIEVITGLEPLKKGVSNQSLYAILLSISKNKNTPDVVLKMLLKNGSLEIKKIIALREGLDKSLQTILFSLNEVIINEALCENADLDETLVTKLQEIFPEIIAEHIKLNDALFDLFLPKTPNSLANNRSLTCKMQETLLALANKETILTLCENQTLCEEVAQMILSLGDDELNIALFSNTVVKEQTLREAYLDEKNHLSLAQNPKTPVDILQILVNSKELEVLKALCKNPRTPVELLYELRLDQRLDRLVSENEAFGNHIKTENIGWQS